MLSKLKIYAQLMRLHRPIGIWLLLWPTLWALWLASNGIPPVSLLIIFTLGTVIMRSAGCVINDFADRHFDGHVQRTKLRPLVTGAVTPKEALIVFVVLCCCALLLLLFLNRPTQLLALIAITLAVIYPFCKRFIDWPQAVLGLAFAWPIPMAFTAINGHVSTKAWLLYLTTVLWILAYDTMYGMVDRADDIKIGIRSTAILFGSYDKLIIASLQSLILFLLTYLGHSFALNKIYYVCIACTVLLFLHQQYLIRHREPAACFKAFLNNHWVGLVIFLGISL